MKVFSLLIVLSIFCPGSEPKPKLSILTLIPYTGLDLQRGESCTKATQLVADHVNNRSDILPDYHVEPFFDDEFVGRLGPLKIKRFNDRFDEILPSVEVRSPIVVGIQYSTGCKATAPMLPYLNSLLISTWCLAPYLSDHWKYPYLYLTLTTSKTTAYAMLTFMREIGRWNRFGIITIAGNPYGYETALFLNEHATLLGFNVASFDMVVDIEPATIYNLKQLDVRIFVLAMDYDFLVMKILCECYHQGMFGTRYVFIVDNSVLYDPSQMPEEFYPGCTRDIVTLQFQQTFSVGITLYPREQEKHRRSHLGYTWPEFEAKMNVLTNFSQPGDHMTRYICHDAFLQAVMALDSADRRLRGEFNLSLKSDPSKHDRLIHRIVNESVLTINVAGLRSAENMTYNAQGQVGSDLRLVAHWSPRYGIRNLATVVKKQNSRDFVYQSYKIEVLNVEQNILNTWTLPNDQIRTFKTINRSPFPFFVLMIILAGLGIISILSALIFIFRNKSDILLPNSKLLGLIGNTTLLIASILLAVSNIDALIFSAGIAALIVGSSLVNSALVSQALSATRHAKLKCGTMRSLAHSRSSALPISRSLVGQSANQNQQSQLMDPSELPWQTCDSFTLKSAVLFLVLNSVVFACWMAIDPIRCQLKQDGQAVVSIETDSMMEQWLLDCRSAKWPSAWALALTFSHILLLIVGCFASYQLGHILRAGSELKMMRVGLFLQITLLFAALLIVVVLGDSVRQTIAISAMSFLSSILTTLTLVFRGKITENDQRPPSRVPHVSSTR